MGKKHYIQQGNTNNCGAYCIAYLLGDYLNDTDQTTKDNPEEENQKKEAAQEVAILDNSWPIIKYQNEIFEASNPFKMRKYLSDGEYKKAILPQMNEKLGKVLANGLNVRIRIRLNGNDITKHPLHHLLGAMQSDAGIGEKPETYLETEIDDSFEYMIGVFLGVADVNAEVKEANPGKYHYILLHRIDDTKWEYIDPHIGQWESLNSSFTLNAPYSFPVKNETGLYWKWMDFGLLIVKN